MGMEQWRRSITPFSCRTGTPKAIPNNWPTMISMKLQTFLRTQNATGKHMVKLLIASIVLAFAAATPAFASVEWTWDFNSNANPAPANVGDPAATANMSVGQFWTGWHNTDLGLGSAAGYWDLGKNGVVTLTIPNLASPTRPYNAYLSIVQWVDGPLFTGNLTYSFAGATQVGGTTTHLIQDTGFGKWVEYDTTWSLAPGVNPDVITITAPVTGAIFDRITVVPEPTTIVAGLLLLLPFGASTVRLVRRTKAA